MARKIKLTRPELKRQRDALARFERYLPMLKLKQQQLQGAVLKADQVYRESLRKVGEAEAAVNAYRAVLDDLAGINVEALSTPTRIVSHDVNVAGVALPMLDDVEFGPLTYSLFATPPWVDKAIADLREVSRLKAESEILGRRLERLRHELTRIVQRVNLFEKVMIPDAKETIRVIRIKLGDEQTAAVGRAKIAKAKLNEASGASGEPAYEEVGP